MTSSSSPGRPTRRTREEVVAAIERHPLAVPIAVVLTDIDGFAELNDQHGSEVGDRLLSGFGDAVDRNIGDDAEAFRIGGDEWAIVIPGRTVESTLVLIEELRAHVAAVPLGGTGIVVAMSAGVAGRPPHGTSGDELIRAADEALMASKRAGRDRVTIYVEDKMVMKSNYYPRATLDRLSSLSRATNRTEASLLREAADKLLAEYADVT